MEDLGGHEVRVAVRGERERVVVRHERIDEAQDVRDRPPLDREQPAPDELRPARRGDDVDAVGELVRRDRVEVEDPPVAGRERVHVRVAVALSEEGDEPQELHQQLVVAQRRKSRDEAVGRGAVLRP